MKCLRQKGTLCKGEITSAKSFLSSSLSPPLTTASLVRTQADWWKDIVGTGKETMETRSWCSVNGKTLKKKTFIHFGCPLLKAHLTHIIPNASSSVRLEERRQWLHFIFLLCQDDCSRECLYTLAKAHTHTHTRTYKVSQLFLFC